MTLMFTIAVFIIVLGSLVFVHELGHFLAAKACNIYVDRFSLGIPPRLFGFQWGETDYCVGALPIGGYVKMAGQEDAPQTEEEQEQSYGHVPPERWFNKKPVWQRMIVIMAGPLMNLVFGVVIFAVWAAMGANVPEIKVTDRIGLVLPESPAGEAELYRVTNDEPVNYDAEPDAIGWQPGDRILRVNGNSIDSVGYDLRMEALLGKGETLVVDIARTGPDGDEQVYQCRVEPRVLDESGYASVGVMPFQTALVEYAMADSPAERQGLQNGDVILEANGQPVDKMSFSQMIEKSEPGTTFELMIERGGVVMPRTITPETVGRLSEIQLSPSFQSLLILPENAPLTVRAARGQNLPTDAPLTKHDEILEINGVTATPSLLRELLEKSPETPVQLTVKRKGPLFGLLGEPKTVNVEASFNTLLSAVTGQSMDDPPRVEDISKSFSEKTNLQRYDVIKEINGKPATPLLLREIEENRPGEEVKITVERPALVRGMVQRKETFTTTLPVAKVQQIGVVWGTKLVYHRVPPIEVIPEAFRQSGLALKRLVQILRELFTGGVSPRELAGPVGIADMTATVARQGLSWLLEWSAFLSINLCVVNLLPLPVLDGGQMVFLIIEAVRRKPVNRRVFELVQQMGLLMIIALVLFVTYNDISRLIDRFLPG